MSNTEMIRYWNEGAAPAWTAHEDALDAQLAPLGTRALERAALRGGEHVLDVGCGCGATTLELAAAVGPAGRVVAVDVSRPMLARAEQRARASGVHDRIEFRIDDAQTAAFAAGTFDVVFSRFGVMFFDDPVAAFANLRGALREGGRLAFVCWQPRDQNPWMFAPALAAAQHVQFPAPPPPDAPGPFAFGDAERVRGILADAGFADIAFEPVNEKMRLAGDGVDEALALFLAIGPVGAVLREVQPTEEQRAKVIAAVRGVLEGFVTPRGLEAGAGAWIVTAKR